MVNEEQVPRSSLFRPWGSSVKYLSTGEENITLKQSQKKIIIPNGRFVPADRIHGDSLRSDKIQGDSILGELIVKTSDNNSLKCMEADSTSSFGTVTENNTKRKRSPRKHLNNEAKMSRNSYSNLKNNNPQLAEPTPVRTPPHTEEVEESKSKRIKRDDNSRKQRMDMEFAAYQQRVQLLQTEMLQAECLRSFPAFIPQAMQLPNPQINPYNPQLLLYPAPPLALPGPPAILHPRLVPGMEQNVGINPPHPISEYEMRRITARKQRPKKFICDQCSAAFSNRGQLTSHTRTHTGERPFTCDYKDCNKKFTRNEELTRHRKIHSGEKPHFCDLCGKNFGRKDHLKKHTNTHLKEHPHAVYNLHAGGGYPKNYDILLGLRPGSYTGCPPRLYL